MTIRFNLYVGSAPVAATETYGAGATATLLPSEKYLVQDDKAQPAPTRSLGRKIRVLLVDDFAVVRQGLAHLLQLQPDIEVVGQAVDGLEAIRMARELQPDVVVMDVTMPVLDGIEATRRIHRDMPQIHVVGLSMHNERDIAITMTAAGAAVFVTKTAPPATLISAIRQQVA